MGRDAYKALPEDKEYTSSDKKHTLVVELGRRLT